VTTSALWVVASLAIALFGFVYLRRSERKEREDAIEHEMRFRRKMEGLLAQEENNEKGRNIVNNIRLIGQWLSEKEAKETEELTTQGGRRSPRSPKRGP
jgi:hypothetical protein